jgi:hypothetical protein
MIEKVIPKNLPAQANGLPTVHGCKHNRKRRPRKWNFTFG